MGTESGFTSAKMAPGAKSSDLMMKKITFSGLIESEFFSSHRRTCSLLVHRNTGSMFYFTLHVSRFTFYTKEV